MVDPHAKKSKTDGYRSRAAYKLLELDTKFRLFGRNTKNIVDLGFAPGAWTQVALNKSRARGVQPNVLGVDLIHCQAPEGAHFIQSDIFLKKTHQSITAFFEPLGPLDLVLSDMMTNTSGIGDNDHFASMELCDGVLLLALQMLQRNGSLVMKFYTGKEDQLLQKRLERVFARVHKVKPAACRAELREMYFVCLKKKRQVSVEELFE